MLGYVIVMAIEGLVMGLLGRLLVPGRQPIGCLLTMLCGLGGALIGGVLGRWLWGESYTPGLIMGALCAALLIWVAVGTGRNPRPWIRARRR